MRISIHALRGEGDFAASEQITANGLFQSTPSVGRATNIRRRVSKDRIISIHALRGEGDLAKRCDRCGKFYISIHALRGEGDPATMAKITIHRRFQSTPSVGRATLITVSGSGIDIP